MIVLDSTSKVLQIVLGEAAASELECQASWRDVTTTACTQRVIDYVAIYNADAAAHVVTVKTDNAGTERRHIRATLRTGEMLHYTSDSGWAVIDARGARLTAMQSNAVASAVAIPFYKVGTAAEAVGSWYSWAKDTGVPGAWAPGAPGINGRATDGTASGDVGCLRVANAPGGSINLLTNIDGTASVAGEVRIIDLMWVNTGIVVTTTTAQAIVPAAIPARDLDGTTNGRGVLAGILVTAATTNAGAITNTTISYTNSDGTAGRTATMASFPATAVVGTVVWFQLQAGDQGVRSVQSITLGTSYAGGSISLILATWLMSRGDTIVNVAPQSQQLPMESGVRLYDGVCMLPIGVRSATTATNIQGNVYVATRAS
jgi:hypothetical protein